MSVKNSGRDCAVIRLAIMNYQTFPEIVITITHGDRYFCNQTDCVSNRMAFFVYIREHTQPACTVQGHRKQDQENDCSFHGGKLIHNPVFSKHLLCLRNVES